MEARKQFSCKVVEIKAVIQRKAQGHLTSECQMLLGKVVDGAMREIWMDPSRIFRMPDVAISLWSIMHGPPAPDQTE